MQLLGTNSSEGGAISEGLDLIQFEVRSLKKIGWINDKLPNIGFTRQNYGTRTCLKVSIIATHSITFTRTVQIWILSIKKI